MAGDITAQMIGSTIYLSEAAGHAGEASQVVVSQLANGHIRIAGDTAHGAPSSINGSAAADFLLPPFLSTPSLSANLGAGNDSLRILPGVKLNAVSLNMSATNAGVNDVDTVDIQGLRTLGAVNISTGDGVDNVFVQNSTIGDGVGNDDLNISTGKGWDYVGVGNASSYNTIKGSLNIRTYDSVFETDGAKVEVNLTTARDYIRSSTDNGLDTVNLLSAVAGQDVVVDTQGGKDTVSVRDSQAVDQFFVLLGDGDDSLSLSYVRANTLFADGGAGTDSLVHQYDAPTNGTAFQGFEKINGVSLFQPHSGTAGRASLAK